MSKCEGESGSRQRLKGVRKLERGRRAIKVKVAGVASERADWVARVSCDVFSIFLFLFFSFLLLLAAALSVLVSSTNCEYLKSRRLARAGF